jgi:hypothetical protein
VLAHTWLLCSLILVKVAKFNVFPCLSQCPDTQPQNHRRDYQNNISAFGAADFGDTMTDGTAERLRVWQA